MCMVIATTVTYTTINRMTASFTKLVVIAIICYAKPNQIVPGNRINNEGIDSKLKRVTRTALSLGPITPKCNYIMLRQN